MKNVKIKEISAGFDRLYALSEEGEIWALSRGGDWKYIKPPVQEVETTQEANHR